MERAEVVARFSVIVILMEQNDGFGVEFWFVKNKAINLSFKDFL